MVQGLQSSRLSQDWWCDGIHSVVCLVRLFSSMRCACSGAGGPGGQVLCSVLRGGPSSLPRYSYTQLLVFRTPPIFTLKNLSLLSAPCLLGGYCGWGRFHAEP